LGIALRVSRNTTESVIGERTHVCHSLDSQA
jgi:hypothetical protein